MFFPQGPRFLTHRGELASAAPYMQRFWDSGFLELGPKLGADPVQFARSPRSTPPISPLSGIAAAGTRRPPIAMSSRCAPELPHSGIPTSCIGTVSPSPGSTTRNPPPSRS